MKILRIYIVSILILFSSCVEEFDINTELQADSTISSILVVEATVTDELKQQQLRLTRGTTFANDTLVTPEEGATVTIVQDSESQYDFTDNGDGNYISSVNFAAEQGAIYQLRIHTQNGELYESSEVLTPETTGIENVNFRAITTDTGELGVGVFVSSNTVDSSPRFLRYDYEETYKIIAPLWSPFDLEVIGVLPPYEFNLVPKGEEEQRVCYNTQFSNRIIQNRTEAFSSNDFQDFLVRFIAIDDFIIANRYSILVKQLSQTPDAYGFYETLNKQSSSSDVFSAIQPGFIEGNVQSVNDPNQQVIGFFEVVSVAQERVFFNYTDLFPDQDSPPYAINCNFLGAPLEINEGGNSPLGDAIRSGQFVYVRNNTGEVQFGGPYLTARRACGDCRELGSNIVPDFWEE